MSSVTPVNRTINGEERLSKLQTKSVTFEPVAVDTPSTSSSGRPNLIPRRSFAHQPRLLGFEDVDLLELQTRPTVSSAPTSDTGAIKFLVPPPPTSRARVRKEEVADASIDDRFRVDDEEGGPSAGFAANGSTLADSQYLHPLNVKKAGRPDPIRHDSYASLMENEGDQPEEEEHPNVSGQSHRPVANGYAEVDRGNTLQDDIRGDDEYGRASLVFESITQREMIWMWTSVILVAILTSVSISIAVGWIDWPGDGLGQN